MKDSKERLSKNEYENAEDRRLVNTRSPSMQDVNNIRVNKEDKPLLAFNRDDYTQFSNLVTPSARSENEQSNQITEIQNLRQNQSKKSPRWVDSSKRKPSQSNSSRSKESGTIEESNSSQDSKNPRKIASTKQISILKPTLGDRLSKDNSEEQDSKNSENSMLAPNFNRSKSRKSISWFIAPSPQQSQRNLRSRQQSSQQQNNYSKIYEVRNMKLKKIEQIIKNKKSVQTFNEQATIKMQSLTMQSMKLRQLAKEQHDEDEPRKVKITQSKILTREQMHLLFNTVKLELKDKGRHQSVLVTQQNNALEQDDEKFLRLISQNITDNFNKNLHIVQSEQDQSKQSAIPRYIIRCSGPFRMRFDVLIIMLSVKNSFMVPLEISLGKKLFTNEQLEVLTYIEHVVDVIFFADIFFNFMTTYVNEKTGQEIFGLRDIALKYIQTSLTIDLLAAIPYEVVYELFKKDSININTTNAKDFDNVNLQILGLLKLIRLLRLNKIVQFMKFHTDFKLGIRFAILITLFLMLIHWVACLFYMLALADYSRYIKKDIQEVFGIEPPSVRMLVGFQMLKLQDYIHRNLEKNSDTNEFFFEYWIPPIDLVDGRSDYYKEPLYIQFIMLLYYSILLIVGNCIAPQTAIQTFFCVLIIITGQLFVPYIFSSMTTILAQSSMRADLNEMCQLFCQKQMAKYKIPEEIQEQVMSFLSKTEEVPAIQQENPFREMKKLLDQLSPILQEDVLQHIHRYTYQSTLLFDQIGEIDILFLIRSMKMQLTIPNERLFVQDDHGDKIFILVSGEIQILIKRGLELKTFNFKNGKSQRKRENVGLAIGDLNLAVNQFKLEQKRNTMVPGGQQRESIQEIISKIRQKEMKEEKRKSRDNLVRTKSEKQVRAIEELKKPVVPKSRQEKLKAQEEKFASSVIDLEEIKGSQKKQISQGQASSVSLNSNEKSESSSFNSDSSSFKKEKTGCAIKNRGKSQDAVIQKEQGSFSSCKHSGSNDHTSQQKSDGGSVVQKSSSSHSSDYENSKSSSDSQNKDDPESSSSCSSDTESCCNDSQKRHKKDHINKTISRQESVAALENLNIQELNKNMNVKIRHKEDESTFLERQLKTLQKTKINKEDDKTKTKGDKQDQLDEEFTFGIDLTKERVLDLLGEGDYFGEIAVLSNMRRTCTAKSYGYCILTTIDRESLHKLESMNASSLSNIRKNMLSYHDEDMELRRRFVINIPVFRSICDQDLITEIVFLMKQETYTMGSSILLNGVQNDNIYVIWDGAVEVRVTRTDPDTQKTKSIWFENLQRGACLNVYAAFTDEMSSLVDFYALTKYCIILKINIKDLNKLSKIRQHLKDKLDILYERIRNQDVDSLDFFTCSKKYIQLETYDSNYSKKEEDSQLKLMKKFRKSVLLFVQQLQAGEVEFPKAVDLLNEIKQDRVIQNIKKQQQSQIMLDKKVEVVNVHEMYQETREDLTEKLQDKIKQQKFIYRTNIKSCSPRTQHKFAELVEDAANQNLDKKINDQKMVDETVLYDGGDESSKSSINLNEDYEEDIDNFKTNLNFLNQHSKAMRQKSRAVELFKNELNDGQSALRNVHLEMLQDVIYEYEDEDEFVERIKLMFRSFNYTFKYQQQVQLIKKDNYSLLQRLDISALETMTKLVDKGFIKKFRGQGSSWDAPFQGTETSEATISVLSELWNSENITEFDSQNSTRSCLLNRNLKNVQNQNFVYDKQFLDTYNHILEQKKAINQKKILIKKFQSQLKQQMQQIKNFKKQSARIRRLKKQNIMRMEVHNDIGNIYDFLATLDDVDYQIQGDKSDVDKQIEELKNQSIDSDEVSGGNVNHESFCEEEDQQTRNNNFRRPTNITMHPTVTRNSFSTQLVETKPKRHTQHANSIARQEALYEMPLETSESSADEEDMQPNVIKNTALHSEESKEQEDLHPPSIDNSEEGQIQQPPDLSRSFTPQTNANVNQSKLKLNVDLEQESINPSPIIQNPLELSMLNENIRLQQNSNIIRNQNSNHSTPKLQTIEIEQIQKKKLLITQPSQAMVQFEEQLEQSNQPQQEPTLHTQNNTLIAPLNETYQLRMNQTNTHRYNQSYIQSYHLSNNSSYYSRHSSQEYISNFQQTQNFMFKDKNMFEKLSRLQPNQTLNALKLRKEMNKIPSKVLKSKKRRSQVSDRDNKMYNIKSQSKIKANLAKNHKKRMFEILQEKLNRDSAKIFHPSSQPQTIHLSSNGSNASRDRHSMAGKTLKQEYEISGQNSFENSSLNNNESFKNLHQQRIFSPKQKLNFSRQNIPLNIKNKFIINNENIISPNESNYDYDLGKQFTSKKFPKTVRNKSMGTSQYLQRYTIKPDVASYTKKHLLSPQSHHSKQGLITLQTHNKLIKEKMQNLRKKINGKRIGQKQIGQRSQRLQNAGGSNHQNNYASQRNLGLKNPFIATGQVSMENLQNM